MIILPYEKGLLRGAMVPIVAGSGFGRLSSSALKVMIAISDKAACPFLLLEDTSMQHGYQILHT